MTTPLPKIAEVLRLPDDLKSLPSWDDPETDDYMNSDLLNVGKVARWLGEIGMKDQHPNADWGDYLHTSRWGFVRNGMRIASESIDAAGRLPRTADGKMVLPGDFVWTFDCANPAGFGFRVLNISETHLDGKEACAEFSKCYSTRALAEAAAKESRNDTA